MCNCECNSKSLLTPQCHQVSTFTCVRVVVFSAFSMHNTQCKKSAIRMRKCRAPERRVYGVTRTRAGVTDETLPYKSAAWVQGTSRMTSQVHDSEFTDIRVSRKVCAGSHLVPIILQWPLKKEGPKGQRGQEFRVHTYPTTSSRLRGRRGRSLVQIGSEMWICKSSKQTNIHLYI